MRPSQDCQHEGMNENEIQAFIDTFNSSREKQRNADLHTQIEELFE